MKDFIVKVSSKDSKVYLDATTIAVDGENLQGNVVIQFQDGFKDGIARLEWTQGSEKYYQNMVKDNETYTLPIKSVMTHEGKMNFQVVVTQLSEGDEIPIFKSNTFHVFVERSLNAVDEPPEEYASWIDEANEKLLEFSRLDIDAERVSDGIEVTINKKDGTTKIVKVNDGQGGSSVSINDVLLEGNKTSADLKICDMPQGYDLPIGQFDGQLFYLIPRQSEAQDTRGLYRFNGSVWHLIGDLSAGIIEINAENHTTINEYEVPVLTDEQIQDAYFGVNSGRIVLIIDDMEVRTYRVLEARCIENTEVAITIMYDDNLILTYQIGRDIKFNDITMKNAYETIKQVGENNRYLFETNYGTLDYEKAKKYYDELEFNPYACSTIVKNNVIGRNFDYTYDEQAEFVVKTKSGKYSSIGIAGQVGLDRDFVVSGEYSKKYEILPFNMQDGINEKGLFASIHIVPQDNGMTTGTIVDVRQEVQERINALMLVRYVLDNFATVDEVIDATEDYLSIYVPQTLRYKGYEVHFLFSDKNKTYTLEFINNVCEWTNISDYPVLTNFFIKGVLFPQNHKLPEIGNSDILGTELTPRSMGIERYNDLIDGLTNENCVKDILESVKYTNTYNEWGNEAWASEYCGTDGLEVTMTRDSFIDTYLNGRDAYLERGRELPITNQTIHSSIYDRNNNKLTIYTQENYDETDNFTFVLPIQSGSSEINASINGVALVGNKTSAELRLQDEITNQTTVHLKKVIFGSTYVDDNTLIASAETIADIQANKQDIIQLSTIPSASQSNLGKIYQYIGEDTNEYQNGNFYKCHSEEHTNNLTVTEGAYFNLGITTDENTTLEVKAKWLQINAENYLIGNEYNTVSDINIHVGGGAFYIGSGTGEYGTGISCTVGTEYLIKINDEEGKITINGEGYINEYAQSSNLFLFYQNNEAIFNGEFYYLNLIDKISGNVLHNFIPFEVNGTPCIKDTITGAILYNQGTGTLTYHSGGIEYYWENIPVSNEMLSYNLKNFQGYYTVTDENFYKFMQKVINKCAKLGLRDIYASNIPFVQLNGYILGEVVKNPQSYGITWQFNFHSIVGNSLYYFSFTVVTNEDNEVLDDEYPTYIGGISSMTIANYYDVENAKFDHLEASESVEVNGYMVPTMSSWNLSNFYNSISNYNRGGYIRDVEGNNTFLINRAYIDPETNYIHICYNFKDIMLLDYYIDSNDEVQINYKEFASKTYVDNAISTEIGNINAILETLVEVDE